MSKLKIVLVDDEDSVLKTITEMLANDPAYDVLGFTKVREVINYLGDNKADVIISDINMEELNGVKLAKIAGSIDPQLRIILMSGFTGLIDQIKHFHIGVEKVLTKPFSLTELKEAIDHPAVCEVHPIKNMVPVKIESLIHVKKNPVDLFIHLNGEKFLKMFHEKSDTNPQRLQQFLDQGIRFLYANETDALNVELNLFTPVRISTLKTDRVLKFNVYFQKEDEYKLLIDEGLRLSDTMMNIIKQRKIKVLYIADQDHPMYLQYLDNILDDYMANKNIANEDKLYAAAHLVEERTQEAILNPTMSNLLNLKKSQKHLIDFIKDERSSIRDLLKLNEQNKGIHIHSTMVASLSYAILLEIAHMRSDKNQKAKVRALDEYYLENDELKEIVFTGALLHDMGKNLLQLCEYYDVESQTEEEYAKLLNHPQVAFDRLKSYGVIHPKSLEIVLQHEEFCDGSGYPRKLKKVNLSFYSQVVILANAFDKLKRYQQLSSEEAIREIKKTAEKFNRHLIPILEGLMAA